jgi:hypothetical protein
VNPRRSLLLSLLTLLAVIVGLAAGAAQAASAPAGLTLKTAVGRSTPPTSALVGSRPLESGITPRVAAHGYDRIAVATGVAAKEAGRADFIVDSRGTAIPTDPARLRAGLEDSGAFTDASTSPATSRKFVGTDEGEPIRIRVERGHPEDPNYTGPRDPLHAVDHLHVDRRANGATGPWRSVWKIPYNWPWG